MSNSSFAAKVRESLPEKRKPKSAKSYVVWLLSRQEYSAASLRDKLLSKEFSVEEVSAAIAFVQEHGFQSDERFAASKARSNSTRQGNWRVKQELLKKGIPEDIAQAQLDALPPEEERLARVISRFQGKEFTSELKQKIYRFLAQRGFSSRSIKTAFSILKAGDLEIKEYD